MITCSNSGQGNNNNNNNSNNNNNNNNNNGRKRRRRKRSTGEPCPDNSAAAPSTTNENKEDWRTLDLGNICDCWSKEDSDEAARVDKSKLEQYSASFTAASNKYDPYMAVCQSVTPYKSLPVNLSLCILLKLLSQIQHPEGNSDGSCKQREQGWLCTWLVSQGYYAFLSFFNMRLVTFFHLHFSRF